MNLSTRIRKHITRPKHRDSSQSNNLNRSILKSDLAGEYKNSLQEAIDLQHSDKTHTIDPFLKKEDFDELVNIEEVV